MQDAIKYVAVSNDKVLCIKGWRKKDKLFSNQIRLFENKAQCRYYFQTHYRDAKYEIVKVIVKIEVVYDEQ